ncbi:uncharacterized protein K489DRAFT_248683 [Dissoconium aciculare CBS 342.82]|uniref:Uncharacterized protein n=1 Tax=Dissoconium aciculare CBS 342.82 TaxID=1314786 RepID=A0A6J3M1U3_9PEZI|nr:uncharacterized protein K489DRAFT_248683 [Dissoconium aciculare CBS 342.82]KAF1821469.1 hypothetical protein K489DRAFT_248683 [Dissoconium aciculare CBS 342.82]
MPTWPICDYGYLIRGESFNSYDRCRVSISCSGNDSMDLMERGTPARLRVVLMSRRCRRHRRRSHGSETPCKVLPVCANSGSRLCAAFSTGVLVLVPDTNLQPHRQLGIRFGTEAGICEVYFQRCRCPISPSGLTGGVADYQLIISKRKIITSSERCVNLAQKLKCTNFVLQED